MNKMFHVDERNPYCMIPRRKIAMSVENKEHKRVKARRKRSVTVHSAPAGGSVSQSLF